MYKLYAIESHIAVLYDGDYYYCDGNHQHYETKEEAILNARRNSINFLVNDENMKKLIDMGYVRDEYAYNHEGVKRETWRRGGTISFYQEGKVKINDEVDIEELEKIKEIVMNIEKKRPKKAEVLYKVEQIKKMINKIYVKANEYHIKHYEQEGSELPEEELEVRYGNMLWYKLHSFDRKYREFYSEMERLNPIYIEEVNDTLEVTLEMLQDNLDYFRFDVACSTIHGIVEDIKTVIELHTEKEHR